MTPAHLLRVYSGLDVEGETTSPYFDAPYTLTRVETWPEASALDGLEPFTQPSSPRTSRCPERRWPQAIVDAPSVELWHLANDRFTTRGGRFSLQSPDTSASARNAALTRLLAGWITDSLNARFYPARLAGQSFDAYAHARGITLTFGWRDRQSRLMNDVVERLKRGDISEASFSRVSTGCHSSGATPPRRLYTSRCTGRSARRCCVPNGRHRRCSTPVVPRRRGSARLPCHVLGDLYVQAMAVGNLSDELARREGLQIANALAPRLHAEDIRPRAAGDPRDAADPAPPQHAQRRRRTALSARPLPQPGKPGRLAVIGKLIEAPFYTRLRTEEQLGYIVTAGYSPILDAPGLAMLVQSPDTGKQRIAQRMEAFLEDFDARMASLDDSALAPYRAAVSSRLRERDNSLGELTDRLWQTLAFAEFDFARRDKLGHGRRPGRRSGASGLAAPASLQPLTVNYDARTTASDILSLVDTFRPLPARTERTWLETTCARA